MTLRYALDCLCNARALLGAKDPLPQPDVSLADVDAEGACCIRSPPEAQQKDQLALIVCLLETAYLALVCEDPGTALGKLSFFSLSRWVFSD